MLKKQEFLFADREISTLRLPLQEEVCSCKFILVYQYVQTHTRMCTYIYRYIYITLCSLYKIDVHYFKSLNAEIISCLSPNVYSSHRCTDCWVRWLGILGTFHISQLNRFGQWVSQSNCVLFGNSCLEHGKFIWKKINPSYLEHNSNRALKYLS